MVPAPLDRTPRKVTVCGGGNGAQTLMPIAAGNLGCPVDIYAPFADEADQLRDRSASHHGIEVTGAVEGKALPRRVSADPADVIPGSDVVVLVLPAFAHESTLRQIALHLEEFAWVGAMPARGGFDYCAERILQESGRCDVGLFGLQTLPWACRILEYGQTVHVLGVKQIVDAAARPAVENTRIVTVLERMLGLRVDAAASLLALTLANTGQLIHPGIMYALFSEWDGLPFESDRIPLFYHSLSRPGARTLAGLSDEIQSIRVRLEPAVDLSAVRPLKEWLLRSYESVIADPSTLQSAFLTNQAYAGLKAPVRQTSPGQFVPDLGARYLAEDVPYGLAVSRAIADLASLETPTMDRIIAWAGRCLGVDYLGRGMNEARVPQKYGLESLEGLLAFAREEG
jgi:hypothetical protein